ncbi:MAG: RecX family transcriptional regulator [Candidatus Daviesbacteria bacterium]|nr:RecX family transcriptional regulator [Candidatus Daviesbacteria bacterium]
MPKITSVEPQRNNLHRFNIFLDGVFAFGADEDLVVSERLVPGKDIQPRGLDKLLYEAGMGKLMEKMYGLFSVRMRSEKEVRDWFRIKNHELRIKGMEEKSQMVLDYVIEKLKEKGMLNDLQFAKLWVEGRRRSKQKGINALKSELFQKGIEKEIIEEVLREESRITNQELSEEQLAVKALEKKMRVWKNLPKPEFKKKAISYLMRQGFDYSKIKKLVENVLQKEYTTGSEINPPKEDTVHEDDF